MQNGICKPEHVIVGANTPVLNSLIMDLTRNSPDMDEPEVLLLDSIFWHINSYHSAQLPLDAPLGHVTRFM